MRLLRTLSTVKLLLLAGVIAVLAAAGAAIAVAAGGGGPTPPAEPLAQALHDGLAAPEPQGITARIRFTNRLFPSGALVGQAGSALMSGASGRLWATNDGRGRLELQSDAGDVQIVWNRAKATVYDASSNTVYSIALPQDSGATKDTHAPPTVAEITDFLSRAAGHAAISGAQPDDVAGQPAYRVSVSPKHDGGLLGSVQLAWDAAQGVPLRVAVYAQGSAAPVLELTATQISYGPVADSDVNVSPPAGAKAVDLGAPAAKHEAGGHAAAVTGLPAVKAAAGFPVAAPDTLVGLPRQDVRLVGTDHPAVVAVYGHGLGAIVVVERKAGPGSTPGAMSALPAVSLDGLTAHELATQLGTALEWRSGGVDTVLAGSLPPAAAEAAARALR